MCNSGENSWKSPRNRWADIRKISRFSLPAAIKRQWIQIFHSPKSPLFSAHFAADRGRGQLSTALESEEHLGEIVCQQLALSVVSFSFFGPPLM